MTSRDFVYWIQGLFELADPKTLDEKQTELIKKHLNLVFFHEIDPSYGDKEHQGKLHSIHLNGTPGSNTSGTVPPQSGLTAEEQTLTPHEIWSSGQQLVFPFMDHDPSDPHRIRC